MVKAVDLYLEASDASENTRAEFDELARALPTLPSDPHDALVETSSWLKKEGFGYDFKNFTVQDVLEKRAGNCLGTPLLIGALLDSRGVTFTPRVLVNPRDIISTEERKFVERYHQDIRYDQPNLVDPSVETSFEDSLGYRFVPLEHLVLVAGGRAFETTSESGEVKGGESEKDITYDQAVSFVLKDRAIEELKTGDVEEARKLAIRGLVHWPRNRELHYTRATIEADSGDSAAAHRLLEAYNGFEGNDSLFHYNAFFINREPASLDKALKIYPEFAPALAEKAATIVESDPREAKFLFGLASNMYSQSGMLSLRDFYAAHSRALGKLFGSQTINTRLRSYLKAGQPQKVK